jgi:hypothetical protein
LQELPGADKREVVMDRNNYIGYSATFTTLTSYEVDVYVIGTFEFKKEDASDD